ncbi:PspC domain-containing protein [Planotetraspora mira]|uniref:PspC domain-containing protein n=1 Tax=Planotetraspora mira TaxID=58121 RepID=UPI001EF18189|nr:PspC domain-containing protein [Planotetraspora mira]
MNEMNTNGSVKQLRRTRNGKVIAGVCSGVGEYIGVDPNILRVVLAVATFFGGLGIGVYAVAWILVPEEGREGSIAQDLINKNKDGRVWQDAKSGWDKAQAGWSQASWNRPAPQQQHQPTGYEQHPYGRPDAPASAPEPTPASAPAPASDAAPAAPRPATATETAPTAPAQDDPPAPKPEDPTQA